MRSYNHSNNQKGWTNNAPRPGYNRGQMEDEVHQISLAVFNPLWRYILERFPVNINPDAMTGIKAVSPTVNVMGYKALPVAIELSQWGYTINFISDNLEEIKKAKKDCELQAGFIKEFICQNVWDFVPTASIIAILGVLEELEDYQVLEVLKLLLKNNVEVITALPTSRDWRYLLKDFNYTGNFYPEDGYYLFIIRGFNE